MHPNHCVTIGDTYGMTRDEAIAWLCWNDPNGCYTDADAAAEGFDPLTADDARALVRDQINDGQAVTDTES